jgi:hypothetical protein
VLIDRTQAAREHSSRSVAGYDLIMSVVVTLNRYTPGTRLPHHVHPSATLSIVVRGWQVERIAGVEHRRDPLSVVYKPDDLEHENVIGTEPTLALFAEIPRDLMHELGPRADAERENSAEIKLLAARVLAAEAGTHCSISSPRRRRLPTSADWLASTAST